jgi:O-antigen/teichoic acid export membrane protein
VLEKVKPALGRVYGALPEGTAPVGVGMIVGAITSYLFVVVSLNALSGGPAAAFSAFWAVIFVAGPGFFIPLEQEVGRALAHRRAQGVGGRPVVMRAASVGAVITVALIVIAIAMTPVLSDRFYHGDMLFVVALAIGLVSFCLTHLTRGVLAGGGRFVAYGTVMGAEGFVRLAGAVALSAAGVNRAGAYAIVLSVAPLVGLAVVAGSALRSLKPGPDAPLTEISVSLGWLLLGSLLMQLLAYSSLLVINTGATPAQRLIAGSFASAFFVARVPVLSFQAVQGTLLPKLAALRGSGKHNEFRRALMQLLGVVTAIGVIGVVAAATIGPTVGAILFKDFSLGAGGLALLAAGSGAFIIALTLAQALMALGHLKALVGAWALGVLTAILVAGVVRPLELRAELSSLAGAAVTATLLGILTWRSLDSAFDPSIEPFLEAIEQEPLEI